MSRSCCSLSARHVVGELQNNAGEYIVTTISGEYAVYADSQSLGSVDTGGNFAILLLEPDTYTH